MSYSDVRWNISSGETKAIYSRLRSELRIYSTDDPAVKVLKEEKRAIYKRLFSDKNIFEDTARNKGSPFREKRNLRVSELKDFVGATGWSMVKLLLTASRDAKSIKYDFYDWPTKTQKMMSKEVESMSQRQKASMLNFLEQAIPKPFLAVLPGHEGECSLFSLLDCKTRAFAGGGKALYEVKHGSKEDDQGSHAHRSTIFDINMLFKMSEQTKLSPHLLLGEKDLPLLCKDITSEAIMDAFSILNEQTQNAILGGIKYNKKRCA